MIISKYFKSKIWVWEDHTEYIKFLFLQQRTLKLTKLYIYVEGFQVCAYASSTRRCHHNEQHDQVQGCQGVSLLLSSPPVDGMKKAQRGIINWTKLKKIIGQLDSIRPHFTSFCAAIMEAVNLEKGQEMYSVCTCACVCPSLPVNRTLIALALQLVDFHSKENFGINKDSIFKVLQCVICEFQLKNSY